MSDQIFASLDQTAQSSGAAAVIDCLLESERAEKRYHKLFDALLMKKKFEWGAMVKQANKNQVEVIAIINPANGPGGIHPNADYAKGIKTLLDSGATLVGYVQTLWGTRDPNEVKNEIEVYRSSHFGFHGVFLDQVPNIWSKEYQTYNYYKMFFDFVKAKNWAKRHSVYPHHTLALYPDHTSVYPAWVSFLSRWPLRSTQCSM